MRRIIPGILFALGLPAWAFAQALLPDAQTDAIAALEAGVICTPVATGEIPAPGTIAGVTQIITVEPPFAAITRRVPAVLGVGFGVKSQSSLPDGLSGVFISVTHPPMGDEGITTQSFETSIRGTDPSLTFYQFDFEYELVPGFWQFEATKDGDLLFRTTFEVLPPNAVRELAELCAFGDLLS